MKDLIPVDRAGKKLQSLYFEGRLHMNRALGLPAQTGKEIKIFKKIFDNYTCNKNRNIRIFEWGSGFSTIYYSEYLLKKGIMVEWHSIDNNRVWHEKVFSIIKQKNLEHHIRLYLKEFSPFWEKRGWGQMPPPCGVFGPKSENEIAYINFPVQFKKKFDIIIIDARFRRHCIQTTKDVLEPYGIAIIHDAQKVHYHVGLNDFTFGMFLDSGSWYPFQKLPNKVWVGSMEDKEIFEILKSL